MIGHIFAIKDIRSDTFDQIFEAKADAAAIRMTKMTMRIDNNPLGLYKEDFALYHIAVIDYTSGVVQSDIRHVADLVTIEGAYDNV